MFMLPTITRPPRPNESHSPTSGPSIASRRNMLNLPLPKDNLPHERLPTWHVAVVFNPGASDGEEGPLQDNVMSFAPTRTTSSLTSFTASLMRSNSVGYSFSHHFHCWA